MPKISLFASSVRPHLWKDFFASLQANDISFEVVFAGNLDPEVVSENMPSFRNKEQTFRYIKTGNIKPAQVYEIARLACRGELLHWTADDAEYSPNLLDYVYHFWSAQKNNRIILSCQTIEDGNFVVLEHHRLFGRAYNTPQMAPLGFMSAAFLQEVKGIDRRYVSGQWDNDILMRAYNLGGKVVLFVERGAISLHHGKKHGGNSGTFRSGYKHDRVILEGAWAPQGRDQNLTVTPFKRYDSGFEPFDQNAEDFLTRSQGPSGIWE